MRFSSWKHFRKMDRKASYIYDSPSPVGCPNNCRQRLLAGRRYIAPLSIFLADELLENLKRKGLSLQGYVNDVVITAGDDNPNILALKIQTTVSVVEEWCQCRGLKNKLCKTEIVLFTRNRTTKYISSSIFGKKLMN